MGEVDSRVKKYEPFFGDWYITRFLGEGGYGAVYEIERNEYGETYKSALKIVSIPLSDTEVKFKIGRFYA